MRRIITVLFLLRACVVGAHEFHFRLLPTDYTGAIEHIHLLSQSSDKMMWLGTNAGLYAFDGRKYKYFKRPDRQQIEVTAITEEKAGQMWIGYQDGLILILNYQGQIKVLQDDSISGTPIRKIVFHPGGRIFIATYGKGLWQYEAGQLKRVSFGALAELTDIYDALADSRGQLWCSTDNGIWIYEPLPVPKTRYLGKKQGLQDDIITQLDPDQNGNVLLGMYDYGVSMYQVTDHSIHELLRLDPAEGAVVKMDHGLRGEIWIATEKSIWMGSPGIAMHRIQLPDQLKARIESMLFDQSGNLWMACGNRLYIANTQLDYLHPGITGIQALITSKDHLWIGCQRGFFSTDKEGHQLREYLRSYKINVLSLYQDGQGLLWIGTFGQGLYIFNPVTGKVRQLTERNQLSNTSILSID
ncbi:MAG TPA: two-component regulator propeller domain-containing protein, partial [Saprospiraceae bacterium]|nr:two-component regulator propeller domain-containing protein [Saprospiraceae bacterium]